MIKASGRRGLIALFGFSCWLRVLKHSDTLCDGIKNGDIASGDSNVLTMLEENLLLSLRSCGIGFRVCFLYFEACLDIHMAAFLQASELVIRCRAE